MPARCSAIVAASSSSRPDCASYWNAFYGLVLSLFGIGILSNQLSVELSVEIVS